MILWKSTSPLQRGSGTQQVLSLSMVFQGLSQHPWLLDPNYKSQHQLAPGFPMSLVNAVGTFFFSPPQSS